MSDENVKYLVEEFGSRNLGAYLHEYISNCERFNEKNYLLENIFLALQKTEKLKMMVKNQKFT